MFFTSDLLHVTRNGVAGQMAAQFFDQTSKLLDEKLILCKSDGGVATWLDAKFEEIGQVLKSV